MAYGNNGPEFDSGAPKKADVLIRSTQRIAVKQEELAEQSKQIVERLNEMAGSFASSSQDSSYLLKQSSEIFTQLQSENSALKQELLYLAKQSENIYAGLAEKITEISDQAKKREDAMSALTDRVNEVSEQNLRNGEAYSNIIDQFNLLAEQNRRNEELFTDLTSKLDALAQQGFTAPAEGGAVAATDANGAQLMEKLDYIAEQLRRTEGAHAMLADKFEILSMRVGQFGYESAKGGYPAPVQAPTGEIDYDLLAQKVADIVSSREVISPDYIASKVAEQVIIPDIQSANLQVSVDTYDIARQVAALIGGSVPAGEGAPVPVTTNVNLDEEALADLIVQKISGIKSTEEITLNFNEDELADIIVQKISSIKTTEEVTLNLDEDGLAEKIAQKLSGISAAEAVAAAPVSINEEELADSIALKVGSLKAEDFEILVDDTGCTSISKEIADKLDYEAISNKIAQSLKEALDLASVVAPDYDEMAERISEKITVAGINEGAIADKAAAALSNYLPEIDTDDIADKVVGAVIDVLNAAPQPTVDTQLICDTITEKLINSQEEHDYDIVLDEDGISKISEIVTEEIRTGTTARFDKVDEDIARLCEIVNSVQPANVEEASEESEVKTEAQGEPVVAQIDIEQTAAAISDMVAERLNGEATARFEEASARFDKVDEDIARLCELVNNVQPANVEEASEENEVQSEAEGEAQGEPVVAQIDIEQTAAAISDIVAERLNLQTSERFDKVDEDIARLSELVNNAPQLDVEQTASAISNYLPTLVSDEIKDSIVDAVMDAISEIPQPALVSDEIKDSIVDAVKDAISGMPQPALDSESIINAISEKLNTLQPGGESEIVLDEEGISKISEIVSNEINSGTGVRFDKVEEDIAKLTELMSNVVVEEVYDEGTEQVENAGDSTTISKAVAAEIEKGVASKLSTLEQNVAKINDYIVSGAARNTGVQFEEVSDFVTLSEVVAAEIDRGISFRLDAVEENLIRLNELLENTVEASPEVIAAEIERGINSRLDAVEENLLRITGVTAEDGTTTVATTRTEPDERTLQGYSNMYYDISSKLQQMYYENGGNFQKLNERFDKVDGDIAKIGTLVENVGQPQAIQIEKDDRIEKVQEDVTAIKEMLASGAVVVAEAAAANTAAQIDEEEEEQLVTVSDIVEPEEEEAEPVQEQASEPEPQPEPVAEPQPEPVAEPEPQPQPEPVAEPEPQPQPQPAPAPVEEKVIVQPAAPAEDVEEEEEEEEEGEDDKGFDLDVLDMDAFSDDELMPGEQSEFDGGVDFENMMKFKRSFIARIIQSPDEYKQYYGEIKHALLSYNKVNSNVAWSSERFNKGRETIARLKIRGKTLCLYLALDPNAFKTSVYHHSDVSNNNSVEGTPMMVKVKSPLGVKKAKRLINEMLALRGGEMREIPERNYAAMYPYETIEDLIEEGLVKDVRKK